MENSEVLKKYDAFSGTKSGFLSENGKLIYLYNDVCCEAKSRRILLKSAREEILAEYADGLTITRCGAKFEVYKMSRRLLDIKECIVLYKVELSENSLFGAFTAGKELMLADSHFTDERVLELIDRLIVGGNAPVTALNEKFSELERAVRIGEVKALNEIYLKYGKM